MARYLGYDYYPFNDPRLKGQQTNMIANGWKRNKGAFGAAVKKGVGYSYLCEKDQDMLFHKSWDWIMQVWTTWKDVHGFPYTGVTAAFVMNLVNGDIKTAHDELFKLIIWSNQHTVQV